MRIIDCLQQSEEWMAWRNRPTASEFSSFITPAKGQYSAQATAYAAKIVAKRLGVYTEPPPTWAMERGTELEPSAKLAYTKQTGHEVTDVGFILPDGTDAYGGSPDGLVGDDGGIEVKCPLPEKLIAWLADGEMPIEFRPQVQALLFISGREWWDFVGFDPSLPLLIVRIYPDLDYHEKMAECLLQLLQEIERIESCVKLVNHELVAQSARKDDVKWA